MDRQRTFFGLWMLAAVTVFSACGVSGDEPGDDIGGGPSRMDGGSNSGAPHTPGTPCTYDQNIYWSCTGTVDPCAPQQQFCQANHTWSPCMAGPPTADCDRDTGPRPDAGPVDGGATGDADTDGGATGDADVEMDGGCMCPPSGHSCNDECGNAGTWWCPPDNPCELECWIEATADHMPCDAGVSDGGGTTTPDADVPPVLDGDACVCPAPEICTTSCGIEGFRLCDRSAGCGLSRCLVLPDSVCPDGGTTADSGPTDSGPMDSGSTVDSGVCTCPPPDFCPVACGWGELVCNPTDCTTSCSPIPGTCLDSGPADAGPTDAGPMDAGSCACTRFGDPCGAACGALGVITCTAAPECREQCTPIPGSTCADAGPMDAGPTDSGPVDSGPTDSGPMDSGPVDAGPADAGPMSDAGSLSGDLVIMLSAANQTTCGGGYVLRSWDNTASDGIIAYDSPPGGVLVVPNGQIDPLGTINNTALCFTADSSLRYFGITGSGRRALLGHRVRDWDIGMTVWYEGLDVTDRTFFCWDEAYATNQIGLGRTDKSTWDPDFVRMQLAVDDVLTGCRPPTGP